jgi:hypothetical protein
LPDGDIPAGSRCWRQTSIGLFSGRRGPLILSIGCLIHAFTIVVIWSVGRAQDLALPLPDTAVLFTVMIGVALVPISIGGWGLRELAVISLLATYGVAPERAFGLALAVGSLPGALAWLLYPFARRRSGRAGRMKGEEGGIGLATMLPSHCERSVMGQFDCGGA